MKKYRYKAMVVAALVLPLSACSVDGRGSATEKVDGRVTSRAMLRDTQEICFFIDADQSGEQDAYCLRPGESADDLSALSQFNGVFNDSITSVSNKSGVDYCVYTNSFYKGGAFKLPAGDRNMPADLHDQVSSIQPCAADAEFVAQEAVRKAEEEKSREDQEKEEQEEFSDPFPSSV